MIASFIRSSGYYVPPRAVENHELEHTLNTSDKWIYQRSGIKQRHWAPEDMSTSDLALEAAQVAIAKSGLKKEDIDYIILGTSTPDMTMPGTGVVLQHKLGLSEIPCLDIRQACSAFVYSIELADALIKAQQYRNILIVGAELHSKTLWMAPEGRDVSVIFGDGAGAVILSAIEVDDPKVQSHVMGSRVYAQGEFARELCVFAPGTALPGPQWITPAHLEDNLQYIKMNGRLVFVHAIRRMAQTLELLLESYQVSAQEVALFFFHQANSRIVDKVAETLGLDHNKCFNTIDRFGNTGAATIPLGLDVAVEQGRLERGMLVACVAFGSGFAWGANLLRY